MVVNSPSIKADLLLGSCVTRSLKRGFPSTAAAIALLSSMVGTKLGVSGEAPDTGFCQDV